MNALISQEAEMNGTHMYLIICCVRKYSKRILKYQYTDFNVIAIRYMLYYYSTLAKHKSKNSSLFLLGQFIEQEKYSLLRIIVICQSC
jgi:hypothetical protein